MPISADVLAKAFAILQGLYNLIQLGFEHAADIKDLIAKGERAFNLLFRGPEYRTPEVIAQVNKDYDDINARCDAAYAERREEALALGLITE